MRHTVLADTGPLYAAADPDDQYHRRAHEELDRLRDGRIGVLIGYPTLLETYTLVMHRLGVPAAHQLLDDIEAAAALILPTPDDYAAAIGRVRAYADQRLTLTDAVLASLGIRLACPVWTYDHHFDLLEVAVWR